MLTREDQKTIDAAYYQLQSLKFDMVLDKLAKQIDVEEREQKQMRTRHFAKAGYEVKASGQYVATKQVPINAHETKSRNVQEKRCQLFAQRCEDKLKRGF